MFERGQAIVVVAGALGAAVAVAVMEMASVSAEFPLMMIPFATSIVLVMGSPDAEPAQPRALVGGHLVSTLVGLIVLQLTGPGPWVAVLAVGLAMIAMHLTRTFHPPAGIDPLVVVVNEHAVDVPAGAGRRRGTDARRVRVRLAQPGQQEHQAARLAGRGGGLC